MKKNIILILLTFISVTFSAQVTAPNYVNRISEVTLNGVCGVPETSTSKMYFSLLPETGETFEATFDGPEGYSFEFDGKAVSGKVTIAGWQKNNLSHRLKVIDNNGQSKLWTLAFTSLPIVCIDVNVGQLQDARKIDTYMKVPAYFHLIDPRCGTNATPLFHHYMAMRIRGATSAGLDKKPFSIEFRDPDTQEEVDTSLLCMRKDGDWILDAVFYDHSKMRNRVIMDIWGELDKLPYSTDNEFQANSTTGYFVEILLNGRYHGIYCLSDKIDRKKLNLKKTETGNDGKERARGLLWEARIKPAAGKGAAGALSNYSENSRTDSIFWEGLTQEFPEDTSMLRWDVVKQIIDVGNYNTNKSRYTETEYYRLFADQAENWFYIDNLVHLDIVNNAFYLRDNIGKNYYFSIRNINKNNKVLFTLWDTDVSFGRAVNGSSTADDPKQVAFGSDMAAQSPISRLISYYSKYSMVDEWKFRHRMYEEWQELKDGLLSVDSVMARIESYATLLTNSGAYGREYNRWATTLSNLGAEKVLDKDLFTEVEFMRNWYTKNYAIMDEKINTFFDKSYDGLFLGDKKYRIVSTLLNCGSVAIGSEHNSEKDVIYISDDKDLTEDCWWYVDWNDADQVRLRNAKTQQSIMYSSTAKLVPDLDNCENTWWTIPTGSTFYRFANSTMYLKLATSTMELQANKYNEGTYFYFVDEEGKQYYPDDIINSISPIVIDSFSCKSESIYDLIGRKTNVPNGPFYIKGHKTYYNHKLQ